MDNPPWRDITWRIQGITCQKCVRLITQCLQVELTQSQRMRLISFIYLGVPRGEPGAGVQGAVHWLCETLQHNGNVQHQGGHGHRHAEPGQREVQSN